MHKNSFYILMVLLLSGKAVLFSQDWKNYTKETHDLISNQIRAVCIDLNGLKWFGTDSGLVCFNGSEWRTYQKGEETHTLADNDINDIAFELTGYGAELWIATNNGVTVVSIEDIDALSYATPYRTDNTDLVSNTVSVAVVDSLHNRWFGTDQGLSRFKGSDWYTYTTDSDPKIYGNDIRSIGYEPMTDKDSIWTYIGTYGEGVSRLYTKDVDAVYAASPYDTDWSGLPSMHVYAVYVDLSGRQWFGTDQGLAVHDTTATKERWTVYRTDDGLIHDFVQAIAEDHEGHIWIGTQAGVSVFDELNWYNFTMDDGLVGNDVRDMAVDLDGSVWLGTDQGISHFTGDPTSVKDQIGSQSIRDFQLLSNYPNPFNPVTTITYQISKPSDVVISIFNLNGQEIRTLKLEGKHAGVHNVQWDGLNNQGEMVPSGIYIAKICALSSDIQQTGSLKMVLIK